MTHLTKTLPILMLLALAAPALAQGTDGDTEAATTEAETGDAPNPLALSMGEDAGAEGDGTPEPGTIYRASVHGDWELRCIKAESGTDPCQLYQLLDDGNGNPVAEINLFPVGGEGQPAAGATVITPLETLLTEQLSMSVDGGAVKKYPFSWCSQIGCFSRMGLSNADLDSFRRGINATLTIVPVAAPDQKVSLNVSLKGFTAGYRELTDVHVD